MRSPRAILGVAVTATCLLGLVIPASADPPPTFPTMKITIYVNAAYQKVCASATVAYYDPVPTFVFTLVAERSDGTTFVPDPVVESTTDFLHCVYVYKNGTDYGNHTEVLTFAGGIQETPDVALGNGTWRPGADNTLSTG